MNVSAFLRWAAVNMLLGSWDNYYATPSNYYLYNSGRRGAAEDFVSSPYFHWIPWDYDNCLGIDYSGTQWQYADILNWPGKVNRHTPNIPLVRNLLRNPDYIRYYLDYMEYMLDTEFNPGRLPRRSGRAARMACGTGSGGQPTWNPIRRLGQPFTGRRYSNDEVYQSGCRQHELRHGKKRMEGIVHYVRMRHDSARAQLKRLRRTMPAHCRRLSPGGGAAAAGGLGHGSVPRGGRRPDTCHALFQQRVDGDDALLKLAGLRFAQMGVAAEVYAEHAGRPRVCPAVRARPCAPAHGAPEPRRQRAARAGPRPGGGIRRPLRRPRRRPGRPRQARDGGARRTACWPACAS